MYVDWWSRLMGHEHDIDPPWEYYIVYHESIKRNSHDDNGVYHS